MNSQAQLSAAQQLASGAGAGVPNLQNSGVGGGDDDDDDIPELEAVEEDGNVDETGVDPKDIELVIQQVGCSRAKAVRVLKESGGDLINASTYMSHVHLRAQSNVLTMPYSYGRERVIVSCFIVSLPHCFALSCRPQNLPPGLLHDLYMLACCIAHTLKSRHIIAPNVAILHSSSTSPSRLEQCVHPGVSDLGQ